jgi:hypothetical protein
LSSFMAPSSHDRFPDERSERIAREETSHDR